MWEKENKVSRRMTEENQGQRLDAALALLLPEEGIQARRRMCRNGRVLVNGRPRPSGFKIRAGDLLQVEKGGYTAACPEGAEVRLLYADDCYAALEKPLGLHTAAIGGSAEPSLEGLLPGLWQDFFPGAEAVPVLVNRLDKETSGIVLAAFSPDSTRVYRERERSGQVSKTYYALVWGKAAEPLILDRVLNTDSRRKTRVLNKVAPDSVRHTKAVPLACLEGGEDEVCTLMEVVIRKGARHQIRAHLADAGFPIVGDALYGGGEAPQCLAGQALEKRLYLHHARLVMPGFAATSLPGWSMGEPDQ